MLREGASAQPIQSVCAGWPRRSVQVSRRLPEGWFVVFCNNVWIFRSVQRCFDNEGENKHFLRYLPFEITIKKSAVCTLLEIRLFQVTHHMPLWSTRGILLWSNHIRAVAASFPRSIVCCPKNFSRLVGVAPQHQSEETNSQLAATANIYILAFGDVFPTATAGVDPSLSCCMYRVDFMIF